VKVLFKRLKEKEKNLLIKKIKQDTNGNGKTELKRREIGRKWNRQEMKM